MKEETEIPKPPEEVEPPKADLNQEYLLTWKKLFTDINPAEITVFLPDDEGFPKSHSFGRIDFWRLEGISGQDQLELVLKFSGRLRERFGDYGCAFRYDSSFFEHDVCAVDEEGCGHMDTLSDPGLISWNQMRIEILDQENARRSEIPKPPKIE
jgi:hypothetical protein